MTNLRKFEEEKVECPHMDMSTIVQLILVPLLIVVMVSATICLYVATE